MVRHGNAAPRSPSRRARCGGHRQGGVAPAQGVRDGVGREVGEHGQHVGFGVPEAVPVVTGPGQALGGDRAALGPGSGLQHVEQREPHRLLDLGVPVDLYVGPVPERVEVGPLPGQQPVPSGLGGPGQRRVGLITHRGQRPGSRPAVGDELDQPQPLPGLQRRGHRHPPQVFEALRGHGGVGRPVDDVVHHRGDPQAAVAGGVHQPGPRTPGGVRFGDQRCFERGGHPRITVGGWQLLVGDQLGLHDHPHRVVEGLHVVADRRDRALHQRHQAGRGHPHPAPGRGHPVGAAVQHPGPKVQAPLMGAQLSVA